MRFTLSVAGPRHLRRSMLAVLAAATAVLLAAIPSALAATLTASSSGWTLAFPPYPNNATVPYAPLESITAVSAGDAWAVGESSGTLLSDHWNGTSWSSVAFPAGNPCTTFESDCNLTGVSSSNPDDVIAVGHGEIANGGWEVLPLAFEWTGSAWHQLTLPSNASDGMFQHIQVFSPKDAWAVGSAESGDAQIATAEHFNGTTWTQVPTPVSVTDAGLTISAIDGSSPTDIWVTGQTETGGYHDRVFTSVLMHFTGRAWTTVSVPDQSGLQDVADVSPTQAWAIAADGVILRWNGTTWTKRTTVPYAAAITALSPDDVWIAGITTLAHFNGSSWTTQPTPQGFDSVAVGGGASVAPSNVWFSGATYPPDADETPAVLSTTTG